MSESGHSHIKGLQVQRALRELREDLAQLFSLRNRAGDAERERKEFARPTLAKLAAVQGYNGPGVRFEYDGREECAIACQPGAADLWDAAPLIEHLKTIGAWRKVSTTVLDSEKLAAEIAAGNIDGDTLEKFKIPGKPAAAYVKFVKPQESSL